VRRTLLLVLLAACGRFGFDASTRDGGGAGGDRSAVADATGSAGPRWAAVLGANSKHFLLAGSGGAPAVGFNFVGATQIPGGMLTAAAQQTASAVVRFDAAGTVQTATVLDAQYTCDARGIEMRGSDVLVVAFSNGVGMPSLGACSVSTGRQDPVVLSVDPAGALALRVHGVSSGLNAQGWNIRVLPDDSFEASGIYSGGLTFGATALPAAGADPNAYLVRLADAQPDPVWTATVNAGVQTTFGPIALEGTDACTLGAYKGSGITAFGTTLPFLGGADDFVARLDLAGNPRFVRGFGSLQTDSDFGEGSVIATGGGCTVAINAPADVTIDGTVLPASAGPSIVATFDASGALLGGFRMPSLPALTVVGSTAVAAYAVSTPVTIGSTTYTPQGIDTIVVELSPSGPTRLLGAVGGAGDQNTMSLAAIGPDALAIGVDTSGELTFGDAILQTTAGVRAIGGRGI
jgi:hypothetical protein